MPTAFVCRFDCEDVTDQVKQELGINDTSTSNQESSHVSTPSLAAVRLARRTQRHDYWGPDIDRNAPARGDAREARVIVNCSKNHSNAFSVSYSEQSHRRTDTDKSSIIRKLTEPDIEHAVNVGSNPTSDDKVLAQAAATLSPDKSLGKIQEFAKQILTSAALVGAIVTGFSAVGKSQVPGPAQYPLIAAVVCGGLSLALAVWALTPRLDQVAIGDLQALDRAYEAKLKLTEWKVQAAGWLLALALVIAVLTFALSTGSQAPAPAGSEQQQAYTRNYNQTLDECLPRCSREAFQRFGRGLSQIKFPTSMSGDAKKLVEAIAAAEKSGDETPSPQVQAAVAGAEAVVRYDLGG